MPLRFHADARRIQHTWLKAIVALSYNPRGEGDQRRGAMKLSLVRTAPKRSGVLVLVEAKGQLAVTFGGGGCLKGPR